MIFSCFLYNSLCLTFTIFVIICFGKVLFGFILLGTFYASCIWIFAFRFEQFSAMISSHTFSNPFSLFFFWNHYYAYICMFYIIPYILYIAFMFFYLAVCCSDCMISPLLSSKSLIHCSLFTLLFIAFSSIFTSAN